jgi:C4-dicarboxylate transporter DctM subunit
MELVVAITLVTLLLVLLLSGYWIFFTLLLVALVAMLFVNPDVAGDSMLLTIWGSTMNWTITSLPLFLWMGEILFRTKLPMNLFSGLAPWVNWLPGRLLHVTVLGSALFAAVSGSSTATCSTVGKISLPELLKRKYPEKIAIGSLAGAATLGLLIPPSIIMIVYGVATDVSISQLFAAGLIPGLIVALLFMVYLGFWSLLHPDEIPRSDRITTVKDKLNSLRSLLPAILLVLAVLGSIYTGIATATEAAAVGVLGALILSWSDGTLTPKVFKDGLVSASRSYCMIGIIMAAASFLTLAMGFLGLPAALAETISSFQLSSLQFIILLTLFYMTLGCFLDGISMVVLTIGVLQSALEMAGIDLLWFGVFIVIVVELAQITPPVGFNLFVLQHLSQREMGYIIRSVVPMFLLLIVALALLFAFPELVLWLPSLL